MKDNGMKIRYKDMVFILGLMEENMLESGLIIICMEEELTR
jgi:hypothetical protein